MPLVLASVNSNDNLRRRKNMVHGSHHVVRGAGVLLQVYTWATWHRLIRFCRVSIARRIAPKEGFKGL